LPYCNRHGCWETATLTVPEAMHILAQRQLRHPRRRGQARCRARSPVRMARLLAAICRTTARGWSSRNRRADRGSKSTASEHRSEAHRLGQWRPRPPSPLPGSGSSFGTSAGLRESAPGASSVVSVARGCLVDPLPSAAYHQRRLAHLAGRGCDTTFICPEGTDRLPTVPSRRGRWPTIAARPDERSGNAPQRTAALET
jgi:hypothetical protein